MSCIARTHHRGVVEILGLLERHRFGHL